MTTRKITPAKIYATLDALDKRIPASAFVVLNAAREHVATIRFAYPRDGMGRLQAFCADWHNDDAIRDAARTVWQYGTASGCGYDKRTAALEGMHIGAFTFRDHGADVPGDWQAQLRAAGFDVIQAI